MGCEILESCDEIIEIQETPPEILEFKSDVVEIYEEATPTFIELVETIEIQDDPSVQIIEAGIRGEKGDAGTDGTGSSVIVSINNPTSIPDTGMVVVDSIKVSDYFRVKWFLNVVSDVELKYFEVNALVKDGVVSYIVGGVVGDKIIYTVDIEVGGGFLELSIINNHGDFIEISGERLASPLN